MPLEQHFDPWNDDVITAAPVGKDTHFVIQLAIAVDADGHANLMFREEINNLLGQ